ncbi:type II toxin-antitoxin system PemK/MazF family toxin [candidate division WOR-3 bacterium]|nr:type II toxin-antitoxin system PemK/MazF family toxin [candidate division WOR-3 bacterium]
MVSKPIPKRGEIWIAKLDKERPVLIIQRDELTIALYKARRKDIVVIPLTSRRQKWEGWLSAVDIVKNTQNNLDTDSFILVHKIAVLDDCVLIHKIGYLSEEGLSEIERVLLFTLGIEI